MANRNGVPVAGIKRYRSAGKTYCYHRATGTRIEEPFGSPEFFARVAALDDKAKAAEARERAGSLGHVMRLYKASPAFTQLAPRTRSDYAGVMDYLSAIEHHPVVDMTQGVCATIRDKAFAHRGRRFANYVLSLLSILLGFAGERDLVEVNVAKGMKRVRKAHDAPEGSRPWTVDEVRTVLATLNPYMRVPFAVMAFTGMRIGDVLALPRSAYDGKTLRRRTAKRHVMAAVNVVPALARILDEAPKGNATTLCVSSRGRPWNYNGLMTEWRKVKLRLEADRKIGLGLTAHGLRHTVAVILREAGFHERQIADMLAQEDPDVSLEYAREAVLDTLTSEAAEAVGKRLAL